MNQSVEIKITYKGETRRFVLEPISYYHLESTIRALFSLPEDAKLITKFSDNENDLITFNSYKELIYACSLERTGPLKIILEIPESEGCRKSGKGRGRGQRGRNGRGKGRGGCGKKGTTEPELREAKKDRVSQKIQDIEAQLISDEILDERRKFLTSKLQRLNEKLEFLESGKTIPEKESKRKRRDDPEFLEAKKLRISNKIQKIQDQLESSKITEYRRQSLNSKLKKFQEKLELLESGKTLPKKERKKMGNDPEFLEAKRLRFSNKIHKIQEQLESSELTEDRREILNTKLKKFQEKLEFLESGKSCRKGGYMKKEDPIYQSLRELKEEKEVIRESLQLARKSEDQEIIQQLRLALKNNKEQIRLLKSSIVSPTPK